MAPAFTAAAFALVAVLSDRPVEEHGSIRLTGCAAASRDAALRVLSWPDLPRGSGGSPIGDLAEGEICRVDYAAPWDPEASARLREALTEAAAEHGRMLRGCMTAAACTGAADARCKDLDGTARAEPAGPGTCVATCKARLLRPFVETCFELVEVRPATSRGRRGTG
jgi:hypothetical protein